MLLDLTLDEITEYALKLGLPKFRGKQIFDALYKAKTLDEISNLSKDIQVFAITHQPIIAAHANAHFKVSKSQDDRTKVCVEKLDTQEKRLEALATLASGEVNSISVSFAKELLKS